MNRLTLASRIRKHVVRLCLPLLGALALAACTTTSEDPVEQEIRAQANDPAEAANRYIFDVDMAVWDITVNPIAEVYNDAIPEPYRNGIRNLLENLQMPSTIINSALQGDWENTVDASVSFLINTTAGLGGIFDIPGNFDKEPRKEDFGQTLAVWGFDEGPYIVLPLIGPSTARDTVGLGVGILTDPLTYVLSPTLSYARSGTSLIQSSGDQQEGLADLRQTSIDFYAAVRSLYRQNRNARISNGESDPFGFDDDW
ncbi:MAG: VacJ family lipoprotein [Rhodospirillales bacterium]|nr:VacJ family lipoprotein [Rhodospirillales bacterium]